MSKSCWVVTPGQAGFESQGRGLAEALGLTPVFKRIRARAPWSFIPVPLWTHPLSAVVEDAGGLAPPWPDLVISCGNIAAPVGAAIRKASGGRTRAVHIQRPSIGASRFDLVIAPRHDR